MKTLMEDILPSHQSLCWALLGDWGSTLNSRANSTGGSSGRQPGATSPPQRGGILLPPRSSPPDSPCPVLSLPCIAAPSWSLPGFANIEMARSDNPTIIQAVSCAIFSLNSTHLGSILVGESLGWKTGNTSSWWWYPGTLIPYPTRKTQLYFHLTEVTYLRW